jgi:hypothetical protein
MAFVVLSVRASHMSQNGLAAHFAGISDQPSRSVQLVLDVVREVHNSRGASPRKKCWVLCSPISARSP